MLINKEKLLDHDAYSKDPNQALFVMNRIASNTTYKCPNCNGDHPGPLCDKPKTTCEICGLQGHLTENHLENRGKKAKHRFRRKKKGQNPQNPTKINQNPVKTDNQSNRRRGREGEGEKSKNSKYKTTNTANFAYDDDIDENVCSTLRKRMRGHDSDADDDDEEASALHISDGKLISEHLFVVDSGATVHIFNSTYGLANFQSASKRYKVNGFGGTILVKLQVLDLIMLYSLNQSI